MIEIDPLEDHLPFPRPVEHDRGAAAMLGGPFENVPGDRARQQPPLQGFAGAGLDHRAVAQDEGQRRRQLLEDRAREIVAPSRRQGDFDAPVDRVRNRPSVGFRKSAVAVEKSAVNIKCQKANQ
jgi:hypothetical protein